MIKYDDGGQLWMLFVDSDQKGLSAFLLAPIVEMPQIKQEIKNYWSAEKPTERWKCLTVLLSVGTRKM